MNKKVRKITVISLLLALGAVMLYIAGILPALSLSFVVVAGLLTAAAVIEGGFGSGIALFSGTSLLGFLISPIKGYVIIYCLFFGYYPIVKSFFERLKPAALEWLLKLVMFNLALSLVIFLYNTGFLGGVTIPDFTIILMYPVGNAAFIIYDIGFSKLISFYMVRIRKNM